MMMMTAELNPTNKWSLIPPPIIAPVEKEEPRLLLLLHPNWLRILMLEGQLKRRSRQAPTGVNTNTHRRQNNHTTCPWNYDDNTTGTIKRQQTNTHQTKSGAFVFCFFFSPTNLPVRNIKKGQMSVSGKMKRRVPRRPATSFTSQPIVFLLPLISFLSFFQ